MRWVTGVLLGVADVLVADVLVDDEDPARELVEDDAALVLVVDVPSELCADTDRANRKLTQYGKKSRIVNALAASSAGEL